MIELKKREKQSAQMGTSNLEFHSWFNVKIIGEIIVKQPICAISKLKSSTLPFETDNFLNEI